MIFFTRMQRPARISPIACGWGFSMVLFILVTGCDRVDSSHVHAEEINALPTAWTSLCLARLVLEIPSVVEVASTKVGYDLAYQLPGIDDIGVRGIRWGNVSISETLTTNENDFLLVEGGAQRVLALAKVGFRDELDGAEDGIKSWSQLTSKGTLGEKESAKKMLADAVVRRDDAKHALAVSGKAGVATDEFAIRRGSLLLSGYFDPVDSRARTFQADISAPEEAGPAVAARDFRHIRSLYKARQPTEIPTAPGFCTAFGLLGEPAKPETAARLELLFRSRSYPNLIFRISVEPANSLFQGNIQTAPEMNANKTGLDKVGVKSVHGPQAVMMLDAPGRMVSHEYGDKVCAYGSCRPAEQMYDFEAETYGAVGDSTRPHLVLTMKAALADEYKSNLHPQDGRVIKVQREALRGHMPPPYQEGRKIFEHVLRSIRLRPGAIAGRTGPQEASKQ